MEIELERSIDVQVCGYVGRGVAAVRIDAIGHLIFTMTDGSELDLGPVIGSGEGQGAAVELDTTLTRSGMAAEAKATGDAVNQAAAGAESATQEAQSALAEASAARETADTAQQTAQSAVQEARNATWVANQARNVTGDLSKLETDNKDDLVVAINELHQELATDAGNDGEGDSAVRAETWIWSDQVNPDNIPLAGFPATAAGIRLRVYCFGTNGETVTFELQPPENMGFLGGMVYGFDHHGMEVIFEDTGEELTLSPAEELMIYGFYYTTPDTSAGGGGGVELWRDAELASGTIVAGENLSRGMDTGLTLGHLRAYRKWLFRLRNAGKATLTDFYVKVGSVTDPARGAAILRHSSGGTSIFYEWWNRDRTKLAVRSVFAGDPARVSALGEPVAVNQSDHWLYHNILTPGAIDRLTDLEGYTDDSPVWFYCTTAPTMDYTWEFRGVTQ